MWLREGHDSLKSSRARWRFGGALGLALVAAATATCGGSDEPRGNGPTGGRAGDGSTSTGGGGDGGEARGGANTGGGAATGGRTGGASGGRGGVATGGMTGGTTGGTTTGGASSAPDAGVDAKMLDAGVDAGTDGGGGSGGAGTVAAGVRWIGRVDVTDAQKPRFSWSGTGFVARFSGTSLSAQLNDTGAASFIFKAVVDGTPKAAVTVPSGLQTVALATGLAAGMHTVELYRQTEGSQGESQLVALTVGGGALVDPPPPPARSLEIVGDSITCGYGLLGTTSDSECYGTESHWDSYGAVTARALGAELSTVAYSGQGAFRNYGGDMTDTAPVTYLRAITNQASSTWDFRVQPQAVVVNLGTNDISNNKGNPGTPFQTAYTGLLEAIRTHNPAALILCVIGPMLSGSDLSTMQGLIKAAVAARAAAGDRNVFFYDGFQTQSSDKAACQYHPNAAENQLMATSLTSELRTRLHW